MSKKTILVVLTLLYAKLALSNIRITPASEFSLLTVSPGKELYKVFGHSAFRLKDTVQQIDIVYNYGTFDFSTPHFYLKFIKGKLDYFLSIESYTHFIMGLDRYQRVYEQKLNLNLSQKRKFLDFLNRNYLPENRNYRYDFFFDNCATRLRDAFVLMYQDKVEFNLFQQEKKESFRDLLRPYSGIYSWAEFGIDIALGLPSDRKALFYEYMFLPDFLMEAFEYAMLEQGNGNVPLVNDTSLIIENESDLEIENMLLSPQFGLWGIFLLFLIISVFEFRKKKQLIVFDKFFFGALGILGLFILFLWFGTEHEVMRYNPDILWAIPSHIIIVFLLKSKYQKLIKYYFFITFVVGAMLILSWIFISGYYNAGVFPLLCIVSLRSFKIFYFNREKL
ncbi:DUF4105 domain-containing protein [Bacteroidota bacterium]